MSSMKTTSLLRTNKTTKIIVDYQMCTTLQHKMGITAISPTEGAHNITWIIAYWKTGKYSPSNKTFIKILTIKVIQQSILNCLSSLLRPLLQLKIVIKSLQCSRINSWQNQKKRHLISKWLKMFYIIYHITPKWLSNQLSLIKISIIGLPWA